MKIENHDHVTSSPNKKNRFSFACKRGKMDTSILFIISTNKTDLPRKNFSGSNSSTERHCICATSKLSTTSAAKVEAGELDCKINGMPETYTREMSNTLSTDKDMRTYSRLVINILPSLPIAKKVESDPMNFKHKSKPFHIHLARSG